MNREDFMRQLGSLLSDISPTEREEALQYYNDYFDDAGPENEQRVIEALGNPARVSESIRRDLLGTGYGDSSVQKVTGQDRALIKYGENLDDDKGQENGGTSSIGSDMSDPGAFSDGFGASASGSGISGAVSSKPGTASSGNGTSDSGVSRSAFSRPGSASPNFGNGPGASGSTLAGPDSTVPDSGVQDSTGPDSMGSDSTVPDSTVLDSAGPGSASAASDRAIDKSGWFLLLVATLAVVVLPVLAGVVSVLFGILASWIVVIFGFGVAALGLFIAMAVCLVLGIGGLFVMPLGGVGMIGCSLLCGGLGLLFLVLVLLMAGVVTPAICRGFLLCGKKIMQKCKSFFRRDEGWVK